MEDISKKKKKKKKKRNREQKDKSFYRSELNLLVGVSEFNGKSIASRLRYQC